MIQPIFPDHELKKKEDIQAWFVSGPLQAIATENQITQIIKLLNRKRKRSEETFMGLRGEIERFLLWLVDSELLLSDVTVDELVDYVSFCDETPAHWVSSTRTRRYLPNGMPNPEWRPFYIKDFKGRSKIVRRSRAQATIARQFSFLNMLFEELYEYELVAKNPVPKARKESPSVVRNTDEKPPKFFSKDNWKELFNELEKLANENPAFERPLFVFALMKSCYLRVSELSERPYWTPKFSDFYYKKDYLFLRVMGKRRKIRSVTVSDSLLPYIERYRTFRSLNEAAFEMDDAPIIAKERGYGAVSQRHLRRIIKDTLIALSKNIKDPDLRKIAESAASHWMRHTGASIDADWRSIVDLSKELGHEDPGTTGRRYVHSDMIERAKKGKDRALI